MNATRLIAGLRDYSQSPAPNFDAVEDVRKALGESGWNATTRMIIANHLQKPAHFLAFMDGLEITHPFQRQALYDHIWGQGSWLKANAVDCAGGMEGRT
jgi:hypothetical protein